MTIVLKNQLEASERSARELEAQIHQQDAARCFDVEDQLRNLVEIFAALSRDVDRWQNASTDPAALADAQEQQEIEWDRQFRRLAGLFAGAGRLLRALERNGVKVEGAESFQHAWRELRGITTFSREQVAAGIQQVARGEVQPLAEVMDELSGRPVD